MKLLELLAKAYIGIMLLAIAAIHLPFALVELIAGAGKSNEKSNDI